MAIAEEGRKTTASRVTVSATVLVVVGIGVLTTGITAAVRAGNPDITAKVGRAAQLPGWEGLVGVVLQILAPAGLLAFGVVLSWMIGREFADGTVTGLFALPVPRPAIVLAKLLVYLMWTVVVAAFLVAGVAIAGTAMRLEVPASGVGPLLARLAAVTVLIGLVAVPAALAATVGRGILPGIATTFVIIVIAQVMAVAGTGAWFPFTAPALWAIAPASVSLSQLALVATVPVIFGALTLLSWARLQLDR